MATLGGLSVVLNEGPTYTFLINDINSLTTEKVTKLKESFNNVKKGVAMVRLKQHDGSIVR